MKSELDNAGGNCYDDANVPMDVSNTAPLALKLIAYQYLAIGVLSIVEILLALFLFASGAIFNIGVFAIPIGRGLLWGRQWSRSWAKGLAWLVLGCQVIVLPSSILQLVLGVSENVRVWLWGKTCSPGIAAVTTIPLAILAAWQIRVLGRKDIEGYFAFHSSKWISATANMKEAKRQRTGSRYSLSTLLYVTAVVALIMSRLCADDVQFVDANSTKAVSTPNALYRISYGLKSSRFFERPAQLTYVVLAPANAQITIQGGRQQQYRLTMPDGQEISASSSHQLYEIVDGHTHFRTERITLEDLIEYESSQPDEWSLEALVRYAEETRAKKSQGRLGREG